MNFREKEVHEFLEILFENIFPRRIQFCCCHRRLPLNIRFRFVWGLMHVLYSIHKKMSIQVYFQAVEFIVYGFRYQNFTKQRKQAIARFPAGVAAVEKATRLLRDRLACKKNTLDEIRACVKSYTYREPAAQLCDWLLRPVLSLFSEDIKTVVFVPDGLLYTIPLSMLYDRLVSVCADRESVVSGRKKCIMPPAGLAPLRHVFRLSVQARKPTRPKPLP
ncbi:MAG: CHAT domain-containing protein [Gammaproteobacteria bacterium]|nr:CHAT domain-containing protein [Gammaproteobacteria bacterium]